MAGMERFTQRARRVLGLANNEAQGFRQNVIGTEHILMGLIIEEGGVAGRVLVALGVTPESLKKLIQSISIPDKGYDPDKVELAPEAQQALEFAVDEARRMGHHYIGTEHMLLGLVRFENKSTEIFKLLNITSDQIRGQTRRILNESVSSPSLARASNIIFSRPLRVFLCHSSSDKSQVRELFSQLKSTNAVDPWLDEEKLLPGQKWQAEIPKAVRNSDIILVCLSKNSIDKVGYIQKEIKVALDVADEQPEDSIFIIPARLEECIVPERLQQWQWVDLFEQKGMERLFKSFQEQGKRLGIVVK